MKKFAKIMVIVAGVLLVIFSLLGVYVLVNMIIELYPIEQIIGGIIGLSIGFIFGFYLIWHGYKH